MLVDDHGRELDIDLEHERLIDRGARHFPAHLDAQPMDVLGLTPWWGWSRICWGPEDKNVPSHIQVRRRRRRWYHPAVNWDDPYFHEDIT